MRPLARHFLATANAAQGRAISGWDDEVDRWLISYDWPGNVRELQNTIERGVVLARGDVFERSDLLLPGASEVPDEAPGDGLHAYLDRQAAARIATALQDAGGVKIDAARALGIERTTLYRLIKKYRIEG